MINKDLFLQLFFNGALRKSTGTREIDFLQKVPIGMTLSLSEKIPIGIYQNPVPETLSLSENVPDRGFHLYWILRLREQSL